MSRLDCFGFGIEAEVGGCIGAMEEDDGEVDRNKLPLHTLLEGVRARIVRPWLFCHVCTIVYS